MQRRRLHNGLPLLCCKRRDRQRAEQHKDNQNQALPLREHTLSLRCGCDPLEKKLRGFNAPVELHLGARLYDRAGVAAAVRPADDAEFLGQRSSQKESAPALAEHVRRQTRRKPESRTAIQDVKDWP